MERLLEVEKLSIAFSEGEKSVVKECSFFLRDQEILGIVGESGSGKTTMVMSILGFLKEGASVKGGHIRYCGKDITPPLSPGIYQKLRGGEIAIIMQNAMSCLDPFMKVGNQIVESLILHIGCKKREAKEKAEELLDIVGIRDVEGCMEKYPFECSGGMQQRICIAIALAGNPRILIADEPTTALDVTVQVQILNLLRRLSRDRKIAVIVISHDLGVVASLCSRLLVMHDGRIIEQGNTEDIFHNSQEGYTKRLFQARKNLECLQPVSPLKEGQEILLETENICKKFRKKEILHSVSIKICRNQTYGLVGESGCGKSTVARTLMGIYEPDQGSVCWKGEKINHLSKEKRRNYCQMMQMIFQNPYQALNPAMTVYENLKESLLVAGILEEQEIGRRVSQILKEVGVEDARKMDYPHQFSGGQLQRIVIARALLMQPEFLVCDEPFSGLDIQIQEQLVDLLGRMKEKERLSMLFIGHDLSMINRVSDVVGVIYAGTLVEEGESRLVMEKPWHPYTKTLLTAADKVKLTRTNKTRPLVIEEVAVQKPISGCPYAGNCRYATRRCLKEMPLMYEYHGRRVRCFLYADDKNAVRDTGYQMRTQI